MEDLNRMEEKITRDNQEQEKLEIIESPPKPTGMFLSLFIILHNKRRRNRNSEAI